MDEVGMIGTEYTNQRTGKWITWDQALFSFRFWKLHSGGQDETKREPDTNL